MGPWLPPFLCAMTSSLQLHLPGKVEIKEATKAQKAASHRLKPDMFPM